jgi:alkylhydroperoxidase family enzyme
MKEAAMARLEAVEKRELDAEITAICEDAERQTGTSMSTRTLAHHPGVVKALAAFRRTLAATAVLDAPLKELVRLKIARLNACRY